MSAQDPFYLVREEIQDSVRETQTNFVKWDRLPEGNAEKAQMAYELQAGCDSINWQLDELNGAIEMASRDFSRFQIDKEELESRRQWTSHIRSQITGIQSKVKMFIRPPEKSWDPVPAQKPKTAQAKLAKALEDDNQNFIQGEQMEQEMLMRDQDAQLDELSHTVTRLGAVSLTIGQELDEQGNLLNELDDDMDGVKARLGAIQRKMVQVIKKSGMKGQLIMIAFLMILLVILIMIAFS